MSLDCPMREKVKVTLLPVVVSRKMSKVSTHDPVAGAVIKKINGFTTAFAVLHLVTLTIKDGSLHGSDHLVQSRGN